MFPGQEGESLFSELFIFSHPGDHCAAVKLKPMISEFSEKLSGNSSHGINWNIQVERSLAASSHAGGATPSRPCFGCCFPQTSTISSGNVGRKCVQNPAPLKRHPTQTPGSVPHPCPAACWALGAAQRIGRDKERYRRRSKALLREGSVRTQ